MLMPFLFGTILPELRRGREVVVVLERGHGLSRYSIQRLDLILRYEWLEIDKLVHRGPFNHHDCRVRTRFIASEAVIPQHEPFLS